MYIGAVRHRPSVVIKGFTASVAERRHKRTIFVRVQIMCASVLRMIAKAKRQQEFLTVKEYLEKSRKSKGSSEDELFDVVWHDMVTRGHCDAIGSAEYLRVKNEWERGSPAKASAIAMFIARMNVSKKYGV